jgi:hypothetical protein
MIWLGVGETADYKGGWGRARRHGLAFAHIAAADAMGVALNLAGIYALNEPDDENGNPDAGFFESPTIQGNIWHQE